MSESKSFTNTEQMREDLHVPFSLNKPAIEALYVRNNAYASFQSVDHAFKLVEDLISGHASNAISNVATLLTTIPTENGVVANLSSFHGGTAVGGGGVFVWDASRLITEANGGTIIAPTLAQVGVWVRQEAITSKDWNVKWFGAKGDGVTDDTAAIQATFNALKYAFDSSSGYYIGGFTVVIPAGKYLISDEINIPVRLPVVVQGSGEMSTLIVQTVFGKSGFVSRGSFGVTTYVQLAIRDMTIDNQPCSPIINGVRFGYPEAVWNANHQYNLNDVTCAPGPTNRLLRCTQAGTTGAFTPFGQLWSGQPSNPISNPFSQQVDPLVFIRGVPAAQYSQPVVHILGNGVIGSFTFEWMVAGDFTAGFTGPVTTVLGQQDYVLGATGLTVRFELAKPYVLDATYCAPPAATGFSVIVGDVIVDGTAQWTVFDGGCGILQENGGSAITIERVSIDNWIVGACLDNTEVSTIIGGNYACLNCVWLANANERNNNATAVSQPGDSANVLAARDLNMNAGRIGIADSGGIGRDFDFINIEAGANTYLGWFTGSKRTVITSLISEGGKTGFRVGSTAPFTGRQIGGNQMVFRNCFATLTAIGPMFDATFVRGTPISALRLEHSTFNWQHASSTGSKNLGYGAGLAIDDVSFSGSNFFDQNHPIYNPGGTSTLLSVGSSYAPGIGLNCIPQVNGIDGFYQSASRPLTLVVVNGANANVANPGVSVCEITAPSAPFSISGITGGVSGLDLLIINLSGQAMTLTHNATSTAANRIVCASGANVVVVAPAGGFGWARLRYSSSQSRWLVMGTS